MGPYKKSMFSLLFLIIVYGISVGSDPPSGIGKEEDLFTNIHKLAHQIASLTGIMARKEITSEEFLEARRLLSGDLRNDKEKQLLTFVELLADGKITVTDYQRSRRIILEGKGPPLVLPETTSGPSTAADRPSILLQRVSSYMQRQWYTTPRQTNALEVYREVLRIDPDNQEAMEGIDHIAGIYRD